MKYDTVILDLDGTLLYTLEDLQNSVNTALRAYGYPERTLDEVRGFVGNGVAVLMRRCAPADVSDERIEELLSLFRPHYLTHMYDTTRPYDGIPEMLGALKANGFRAAIVSNKLDAATKELNQRFFHGPIAIGTPPDAKKPNPYGVFLAIKELGSCPESSIYVGDSDVDLQTATNAGIPCVGVSWGFRGRAFLEAHHADYIIDTPGELLPLLLSL